MSNLVYYVCVGIKEGEVADDYHVDMCRLSIKSLRKYGDYAGEIMLLTDRPDDFTVDYTVDLSPHRAASIYDVGRLKMEARTWIDVRRYDSILYLDNDVISTGDIQPILDLPEDTIAISEEYPVNMLNSNIPFLTNEEKQKSDGMLRINTGIMCYDSSIFLDTTEKIYNYLEHCLRNYEYTGVEQKPVNAMVVRREIPYQPIPHAWVEMPLATRNIGPPLSMQQTRLLHFAGTVKHIEKEIEGGYENGQLGHMKRVMDLIERNDRETIKKEYSK